MHDASKERAIRTTGWERPMKVDRGEACFSGESWKLFGDLITFESE